MALITSHPEIQARAHAELDEVIGRDYWPSAADEQQLPYIRAIIKEVRCETCQFCLSFLTSRLSLQVLRTHAPFWIAAPHFSTEDFVYNGMYIPKNTAIILNCYGIHHNEEKYPDAYAPIFPSLISSKG
jgi:cytochrome P450